MAKKEESKNVPVAVTGMTMDNVVDLLSGKITSTTEMNTAIDESINKEIAETTQREIKNRKWDSLYEEAKAMLDQRHSKNISKLALEELTERGNLRAQMCGGICDDLFIEHNKLDKSKKEFEVMLYDNNGKYVKTKIKKDEPLPAIDYVIYDTAYSDIRKRIQDKRSEIDKNRRLEQNKIEAAFGTYWNRSWRNNW